MKKCLRCDNEAKRDYCGLIKTEVCSVCKESYEYKCLKKIPKACSKKCSLNVRNNKCVHCNEPAKEKYCKKRIDTNCLECDKPMQITCTGLRLVRFCSNRCGSKNAEVTAQRNATQIEKYGALGFNTKKQEETMLKRYGVKVPAKNEAVKQKIRETQLKNNGGVFAFNTKKQRDTMMEKYNSLGRLGDPEEMQRQMDTMMERYGVRTPTEHPEFLDKSMNTLMERYGSIFNNSTISKINRDYAQLIRDTFNVEVDLEKLVDGSFFDLHIVGTNILLDINPTVTHNSTLSFACRRSSCKVYPCDKHEPISRSYHQSRANKAKENGFRLIQVYDWDSQDSILSLIKGRLHTDKTRVSARSLRLDVVSQRDANKFLNTAHIQGGARKQTHCYALTKDEVIIAVATFGPSRYKSKLEYEFVRYAVDSNYIIHGGAARLFKAFVNEVKPKSVVSYIDFDHTTSQELFLSNLGFTEVDPTSPGLKYFRYSDGKMVNINTLLMIGADRALGTTYGSREKSGLDNDGIMTVEGFVKVYDSGNRVFEWYIESEE